MCDSDIEGPSCYVDGWRRARIDHRCSGCKATTIHEGDLYWTCRGQWEGFFTTFKHCAGCHAVFEFLVASSREPVALDLDCGETLDPADPASSLAFWTRADAQGYAAWCRSEDTKKRQAIKAANMAYHEGHLAEYPTTEDNHGI